MKENKMAEKGKNMSETKETKEIVLIESSTVKPVQDFTDLKSFQEVEVSFEHPRYKLTEDGAKAENIDVAIKAAMKLFATKEGLRDALLGAATSAAYAAAKTAALAKGDYLTPDLRSAIAKFCRNSIPSFAELNAKASYERWLEGFKGKKPGAIKVLQIVRADASQFGDL
jgi:hypothetical protein